MYDGGAPNVTNAMRCEHPGLERTVRVCFRRSAFVIQHS